MRRFNFFPNEKEVWAKKNITLHFLPLYRNLGIGKISKVERKESKRIEGECRRWYTSQYKVVFKETEMKSGYNYHLLAVLV